MIITKEGYLQKWTNYLYGWKKRYFVLKNNLLCYCKGQGMPLKGKISLQTIDLKKHPKKENEFILETGIKKFHLKANTQQEATEWCQALNLAKSLQPNSKPPTEEKKSLGQKISKLWEIFEMISSNLQNFPEYVKLASPEIKDLVGICAVFKDLASEIISMIEDSAKQEPPRSVSNLTEKDHFKLEDEDDDVEFEDAKSHNSSNEDSIDPRRKCLPCLRNPNQKYNIWKVVKDSIGKDLSKMAVPVYYNEPISFLQRFTEDLTYHEVILNAAEQTDPCLRLAYIAAFGVSSYVSTQLRTMKPFNPLLGETFELVRDGYRVICEQVSHHPPISAIFCEHEKFLFSGSINIKSSFKGTHLNCLMLGNFHISLKKTGDNFIWTKPQTNVHNIIFGKMYVDHYGKMEVVNSTTGDRAELNFNKKGWFEKVSSEVKGIVVDSKGTEKFELFGQWNQFMSIKDLRTGKITTAWEKYPDPDNYDHNYWFSDFAIQLNLPPESFPGLPPSDSRFRPDQRALENGDLTQAVSEKARVEEKQRKARKVIEKSGNEYSPLWFALKNDEWSYSGGYWEARDNREYKNWPDIF